MCRSRTHFDFSGSPSYWVPSRGFCVSTCTAPGSSVHGARAPAAATLPQQSTERKAPLLQCSENLHNTRLTSFRTGLCPHTQYCTSPLMQTAYRTAIYSMDTKPKSPGENIFDGTSSSILDIRGPECRYSPQISAPEKEMPTSPGAMTAGTCHLRSCQVDAESPVQCAVYAPDPTKDDLHAIPFTCLTGHPLGEEHML